MRNNLRIVNQNLRQRIEHDLVLTRIGELTRRATETLMRAFFLDYSGAVKANVMEGFVATPGAALDVDLSVPATASHDLDGDNIRWAVDNNSGNPYNVVLDPADPVNPRIDIICARVAERTAFTDASASIADPTTKTVSPASVERDIEYYFELAKVTGVPGGAPVPPAVPAGTPGSITGTPVITTVDLSLEYILALGIGEDSEFVEIDLRGATPSATTIAEVIGNINAAGFGVIATNDGGDHLVITAPGTGETSVVKIKQPSNSNLDAYNNVLGGTEFIQYLDLYRGGNPYFKVTEVYVPALAVTLTAGNIRSIEEKDAQWASDAGTIRIGFSLSGPGTVPLGAVIPVITANGPVGATVPGTGVVSAEGMQRCDGAAIPVGNQLTGVTPTINDSRYIRGINVSGNTGLTGGANTHTLSKAELPTHVHTLSAHTHTANHDHPDDTSDAGSNHTHTIRYYDSTLFQPIRGPDEGPSVGTIRAGTLASGGESAHTHNSQTPTRNVTTSGPSVANTGDGSGDGLAGNAHNNEPQYIDAIYLMRVN